VDGDSLVPNTSRKRKGGKNLTTGGQSLHGTFMFGAQTIINKIMEVTHFQCREKNWCIPRIWKAVWPHSSEVGPSSCSTPSPAPSGTSSPPSHAPSGLPGPALGPMTTTKCGCMCVWRVGVSVHGTLDNFLFCSISNTWHFLYSALPDKNSKDYLKRCTKFVNSTVVVHYFAISSSTVPWVSVNMVCSVCEPRSPHLHLCKGTRRWTMDSVTINKKFLQLHVPGFLHTRHHIPNI